MRALSVQQPWASLIIIGAKQIETRSWPCPPHLLGETIAIHASAGIKRVNRDLCTEDPFYEPLALAYRENGAGEYLPDTWIDHLPLGAVLGTARIVSCIRTEELLDFARALPLSEEERAFGD